MSTFPLSGPGWGQDKFVLFAHAPNAFPAANCSIITMLERKSPGRSGQDAPAGTAWEKEGGCSHLLHLLGVLVPILRGQLDLASA